MSPLDTAGAETTIDARSISRRTSLRILAGGVTALPSPSYAQPGRPALAQWVESFRARALARGVSEATYSRVMQGLKPDTAVFELDRNQPEFGEKVWQYLNRRVSDWRIATGKEKAKEYAPLFARIERDFGVD